MSGRIAISQIPTRSHTSLPPEVKEALIRAKQDVRAGRGLTRFRNNYGAGDGIDGPPLPDPSNGCAYAEFDVGQDRDGKRGVRRLVLEYNTSSLQVMEVYYTDEHYAKFSFFRVV